LHNDVKPLQDADGSSDETAAAAAAVAAAAAAAGGTSLLAAEERYAVEMAQQLALTRDPAPLVHIAVVHRVGPVLLAEPHYEQHVSGAVLAMCTVMITSSSLHSFLRILAVCVRVLCDLLSCPHITKQYTRHFI
jgi:hypothetical protein